MVFLEYHKALPSLAQIVANGALAVADRISGFALTDETLLLSNLDDFLLSDHSKVRVPSADPERSVAGSNNWQVVRKDPIQKLLLVLGYVASQYFLHCLPMHRWILHRILV